MISEKDRTDSKKRGLGRGLSALFEDDEDRFAPAAAPASAAVSGETSATGPRRTVGIDQLEPGQFQPRQYMEPARLNELAESIAVHGVLQPIIVRQKPGSTEKFEIIAGERRWRAAQKAQLHEVPVVIKVLTDVQALEIALIENLQRADLNVLEEAQGYQRLMDEFGHTQEKLAAGLGKSRSHVANTLRLLNLPAAVQTLLQQGKLTAGHARALVAAKNPEILAQIVLDRNLNVRETEKLVAQEQDAKPGKAKKAVFTAKDGDTIALEKQISETLGLRVFVNVDGKGKGSVKIDVKSLDQLDEVIRRLAQAVR